MLLPTGSLTRLGLALALATACAGASARADAPRIYKWVDSNGIAHYTTDPERVPKALRDRIESLEREPARPEPSFTAPPTPVAETPEPAPATPEPAPAPPAPPEPARAEIAPPRIGESGGEEWATRNALPRARSGGSLLAEGEASPEQREALAQEREALDGRIAELEAAIAADESVLKDLITDPKLDDETPLFDRPEFLEVSRRLPELQEQLAELRDQREQLETP